MTEKVKFPPEPDTFYQVLAERVNDHFIKSAKSKYGSPFFFLKVILLLSTHLFLYLLLINSSKVEISFISLLLLGPSSILVGINIAHDAAHGAISKHKVVNNLFLFLFDLLGANSYMWKKRHVYSHHIYPNIIHNDADLKQNPMVRIFPEDNYQSYHKYQHFYAPFLYLLYTINWLFFRDFQDFYKKEIGSIRIGTHHAPEFVKLFFCKGLYITYLIIIPSIYSSLSLPQILLGCVLMNFLASMLITIAIIPSHVAESSLFPLPDKNGVMPYSWSHHQVLTVIDFATESRLLNFFFGGFNHHVAHHLFPHVCHVHYPSITPIIKRTAEEFDLKYRHETSLRNAYLSHLKLLRNNGRKPIESLS